MAQEQISGLDKTERVEPTKQIDPSHDLDETPTFCVNHPRVETGLRCNRCGDPICVRCAVRTPVGYRCKKCVKQQQSVYYTGLPLDYVLASLVSIPLAALGAYLVSFLGIFLGFFISPAAGAFIADMAWRIVGRRRSRYLWLVVSGSIIVATLGVALYQAGAFSGYLVVNTFSFLEIGLYLVLAVSAAYSRLRLG
jgi:hypothetical protein